MIDVITPVIAIMNDAENFDGIIAVYLITLSAALFAFLVLFLVALYK